MKVSSFSLVLLYSIAIPVLAQEIEYYETPVEKGYLKGDERIGIWEFYDGPNNLAIRIDYEKGQLLFIQPDTSDYVILEDDRWIRSKLSSPPRFHGSKLGITDFYFNNLRLPDKAKRDHSYTTVLTFEVGGDGIAKNPQARGDDPAMKEELLRLFKIAPNAWLAGVKDKKIVTSRLAITYTFCAKEQCPESKVSVPDATVIYSNSIAPTRAVRFFINDRQPAHIAWSPDDSKIVTSISDTEDRSAAIRIIDIASQSEQVIKNFLPQRFDWKSNEKISFSYKFSFLPQYCAEYDVKTKKIVSYTDSLTYGHIFSPDKRQMAFISAIPEKEHNLYILEMATNQVKKVVDKSRTMIMPITFSPDNSMILISERNSEDKIINLELLDLQSGRKKFVPLLNVYYSGWSSDGKSIYFNRYERGDYEYALTLFRYDVESNQFAEIFKKEKKVFDSFYSAVNDEFLILKKNGLFALKNGQLLESAKFLTKDAALPSWSNNGKLVSYLNPGDGQLYVIDIATGNSSKMTNWKIAAKKN